MSTKDYCEICDHKCTIRSKGHKTCLSCGLEERYLSQVPDEGYKSRIYVKNTGPDHVSEIRKKMIETMSMAVYGPHNFICPDSENPKCVELVDHRRTELADEFYEWLEELCQVCNELSSERSKTWLSYSLQNA